MRDTALAGLAVGFFDGVHRGHQAILRGAVAALTFRNHPLTVLAPERAPRLIMTADERLQAIRACGVGEVTMLEFTPALAALSAEEFAERYLAAEQLRTGAKQLICGENWHFGKAGAGNADFLRRRGFAVEVVPYVNCQGAAVSSSRIRSCLEHGEIEAANAMLGRPFQVQGEKAQGKGMGRTLGYPTVNLQLSTLNLHLPLGVYEVEANGMKGIANYGLAPTMGAQAWTDPILEVHFLDHRALEQFESLNQLAISIIRFLRPERRFDSVAELQAQIAADCAEVAE